MTRGRSPYADDPDTPHYGPGAAPHYGPPADPAGYGFPPSPTYGPPDTPTHGPSGTAIFDPSAGATYGTPTYGPGASTGTWPAAPGLDQAGYAGSFDPPTPGAPWAPAPIQPPARPARPRRRGQWLSWTVLVLAVVVAAVLGACTYLGLATLRISAADPWGVAWTWLTAIAAAAAAAVLVFLLGVVALVVSRPKLVAALATVVALVLPVVVLKFALSFGIEAAARHAAMDGGTLVDLLTAGVDQLGSVNGPVRDVLDWVLRQVAGQV
jgi:hypothetical protein